MIWLRSDVYVRWVLCTKKKNENGKIVFTPNQVWKQCIFVQLFFMPLRYTLFCEAWNFFLRFPLNRCAFFPTKLALRFKVNWSKSVNWQPELLIWTYTQHITICVCIVGCLILTIFDVKTKPSSDVICYFILCVCASVLPFYLPRFKLECILLRATLLCAFAPINCTKWQRRKW